MSKVGETKFRKLLRLWDVPGFLISPEISEFAQSLVSQEMADKDSWGECPIPLDAKRHAQATAIALPNLDGSETFSVFVLDEPEGEPAGSPKSIVMQLDAGKLRQLGEFVAGGNFFIDNRHIKLPHDERHIMAHTIAACAFVLSIINQPALVRTERLLTRQQRRAQARGGAKAADAWHRVTWDIGKETTAKISRDPDFHNVPLHWRRGHWRRAQKHYSGAVQRTDALRPEDRLGWWQWINGTWVGHPAFGIKRSVHAPRLSGQVVTRKWGKA